MNKYRLSQIILLICCAISNNTAHSQGTVYTWGNNANGQLGNGSTVSKSTPQLCAQFTLIPYSCAGGGHSGLIGSDGNLYMWGDNTYGQLGDGTTTSRLSPTPILSVPSPVALALGGSSGYALKADGTIVAWGRNTNGQLGNGGFINSSSPVQVSIPGKVVLISAGSDFACALTSDGKVYSWGRNDIGQLGNGDTTALSQGGKASPHIIHGIPRMTAISCGGGHTLGLAENGDVYAWGNNASKQTGSVGVTFNQFPVIVNGISNATMVSAGGSHSAAIGANRAVYVWGDNNYGQLGNGSVSTTGSPTPTIVPGLSNVITISCGGYHTAAITGSKLLYAWGDNQNGQMGVGYFSTAPPYSVPVPTQSSSLSTVAAVSCGGTHTVATVNSDISVPIKVTLQGWVGASLPQIYVSVDGNKPVIVNPPSLTFTLNVTSTNHTISIHPVGYLSEREVILPSGGMPVVKFAGPNGLGMTAGDTNGDSLIDDTDLLAVINHFLSSGPVGDVNGDGIVDDTDILLVINNFLDTGDV